MYFNVDLDFMLDTVMWRIEDVRKNDDDCYFIEVEI